MGLTHTVLIIPPDPACTDNLLRTTLLSEWRLRIVTEVEPVSIFCARVPCDPLGPEGPR